nr:unnamed protein product [Callosobruchus chinensis]
MLRNSLVELESECRKSLSGGESSSSSMSFGFVAPVATDPIRPKMTVIRKPKPEYQITYYRIGLVFLYDVRSLSAGRVSECFNNALCATVEYFKQRDESVPELENANRLEDLGFLIDITEKLNKLNLKLQGRDKELAEIICDINAFIKKLELWELNLIRETKHFPTLSEKLYQNPLQNYDSRCHVEIDYNLKEKFKNCFEDFKKICCFTIHGD